MHETSKDTLVTVRDVATILDVSLATAYRYTGDYKLIPIAAISTYGNNKIRKLFRFEDVLALRNKRTPQPVEA